MITLYYLVNEAVTTTVVAITTEAATTTVAATTTESEEETTTKGNVQNRTIVLHLNSTIAKNNLMIIPSCYSHVMQRWLATRFWFFYVLQEI